MIGTTRRCRTRLLIISSDLMSSLHQGRPRADLFASVSSCLGVRMTQESSGLRRISEDHRPRRARRADRALRLKRSDFRVRQVSYCKLNGGWRWHWCEHGHERSPDVTLIFIHHAIIGPCPGWAVSAIRLKVYLRAESTWVSAKRQRRG